MNQKFESIAEESMVHVPGQTGLHHRAFSLERFAELIVAECVEIIKLSAGSHLKQDATESELKEIQFKVQGALAAMSAVADHFGVK